MTTYANELEKLWKIMDTLEENGAEVEDFDIELVNRDGLAGMMSKMVSGRSDQEAVYTISMRVNSWDDPGEPLEVEDVRPYEDADQQGGTQ